MGPTKLLHGLTLPGGVKGEDFNYFHELIVTQELVRTGTRGYADGLQGGMVIGVSCFPLFLSVALFSQSDIPYLIFLKLPPVINFGSKELKARIIPDVLAGRK